jgi:hypothetical protein
MRPLRKAEVFAERLEIAIVKSPRMDRTLIGGVAESRRHVADSIR